MRLLALTVCGASILWSADGAAAGDRPVRSRFRGGVADAQCDTLNNGATASGQSGRGGENVPTNTATYTNDVINAQIRHAVQNDPALYGAWMEVGPGRTEGTFYVTNRVVDASQAERQIALLDELARRWMPAGNYEFDTAEILKLPFTELADHLRLQTEINVDLSGCVIDKLYCGLFPTNKNDKDWAIYIAGRIASDDQKETLLALANNFMRRDPRWVESTPGGNANALDPLATVPLRKDFVPENMTITIGSSARAMYSFTEGVRAFEKGDHATARDWIRLAAIDDRENAMYRYWWALCELADGDRDGAYAQLIVARQLKAGGGVTSSEILLSMRRIQGSIRQELRELDTQAAVDVSSARGTPQRLVAN